MDNQQRIINMAYRNLFPDETVNETMMVAMYEFGDLAKSIFYMKKRGIREGYGAEAKKAIGDLIAQLKIICGHLGLDFQECEDVGFNALLSWFNYTKRKLKEGQ